VSVKGRTPAGEAGAISVKDGDADFQAERALATARADEIAAWGRRFDDWVPPALGPLPDELRERAARLLQNQLAVAERIVVRITQSQRQREVAARMSYGATRPVAAYFDEAL